MAHTVKISDGTTTIDLRGSNYSILLNGWVPNRAQRITGGIGLHKYAPVVEELRITIKGTSSSDVMTKLTTLSNLMDQVELWKAEDPKTAVYFEYEPPGSGLAASVKSTIIGPPPDGVFLHLPSSFDFILQGTSYQLGTIQDPIVLRFTRLGVWLGATETKSSSISTGNPAIVTAATFTDTAPIPWPCDVEIDFDVTTTNAIDTQNLFILITNAANKLYFKEAESMTLDAQVTSETDTGASAGSVARVNSEVNTSGKSITDSSLGFASGVNKIALYAMMRNRSASTVTWTVKGTVSGAGSSDNSKDFILSPGDTARKVVFFGILSLTEDITDIFVTATNDVTGGASDVDDLDIDYVCAIAIDDNANILKTYGLLSSGGDSTMSIDHLLLSKTLPSVYVTNDAQSTVWAYMVPYGKTLISLSGNVASSLIFGNIEDGAVWLIEDGASAEVNITLHVSRQAAYLTPL